MTGGTLGRVRMIALAALVLAGCIPAAQSAQVPARGSSGAISSAHNILDSRIRELGRSFNGEVGIAVREVETGWAANWHGERYYPQQSVSKFWVAITALQAADAGQIDVNARVTLRREDLTLFHQPVAADIGPNGYTTTIDNFMFRALTTSDNTCNDVVLRQAGGPQAVRAMIERNRLEGVRFGPGERLMQSQIAGLQWSPAYSVGNAFYQARNAVPTERRRTAFESYIEDPIDGATPDGITTGLVPGWQIAHKTGTGQVLGATQAGYNDIGILTSPEGRHYAVAVMIGRTATPLPVRMALMQNVTRAVIAYNEASAGSDGGRYQRR